MKNVSLPKWQITQTAIARRPDPQKKKKKFFRKFTCCYTSVPIYGSKFWNLGGQKNSTTFWHLENPQKSALFSPGNSQSVTYSKIQTKVCRVPWGPPMDWFLIKSVNAEYPLSCRKCVEKQTFCILCPAGPPKCVSPPEKMVPPYSLGTYPPTNPRHFDAPLLLHWEKIDFLKASFFGKLLERPWSRQKLTYVKIDQEGS